MADAGGIRAGKSYVEMGLDDSALQKGLKASEAKVKAFGATITGIGLKLGALGTAITAPLIAATAKFAESGSALQHMSERTGISVEALSALGFAARQSGTDMETVEVGIRRMQKSLVAGSEENQAAAMTFNALGLSVQALSRLNPEQQFEILGKRIAEIRDPTARAGAAMQVFGRSGTQLLPLIQNLDALTKEAKDFGLVTSTEAAEGAHKLEQSMNLLSAVASKIVTTIGSALAPSFEAWNIQMAQIAKQAKTLIEANKPLIVTISTIGFGLVAAGAAFVVLGTVITGIGATLGGLATIVGVLTGALALLATPLGGLVLGFALATTAMGKWGETGAAITNFMKGQFGGLLETAQHTFTGIADAMKAGDIQLAVKILWAGLKVEWLKGVQYISGLWSDVSSSGIEAFASLQSGITSTLTDLWAWIASSSVKASFAISDAFENAFSNINVGFRKVMELIGVGSHEATQAAIEARDTGVATSQAGKQEVLGGIESRRQGAQGVIQGDVQARVDAAKKSSDEKVLAASKELADAQKELANLATDAKVLAIGKDKELTIPKGAREGGEPLTPEGIDKGLEEAKAKTQVTGGFGAQSLAGAGFGQSIQQDQLKEQKKATDKLTSIDKKVGKAQQVFAT